MSEHDIIADLLGRIITEQQATNEAITKLAEAIGRIGAKVEASKVETTKAIAKAAAPESAAPAQPPAAPPPAAAPVPADPTTLDYKRDVAPTMAKLLAAKGAPAVVALLSTFGVKKGLDLPADKLAEALAAATAALES